SGGRSWAHLAEAEADLILEETERWAPGFTASVRHRYIQTPENIESELGLVGGNVMHVEMSLDQMFMWRPSPELSGYRVPGAPGMYLTGASTHPGGGVSGTSGRNTAHVALADAREGLVDRLRRVT